MEGREERRVGWGGVEKDKKKGPGCTEQKKNIKRVLQVGKDAKNRGKHWSGK